MSNCIVQSSTISISFKIISWSGIDVCTASVQIKTLKNRNFFSLSTQYCRRLHRHRLTQISARIVKMLSMKQRLILIAISVGLFCCYSVFGILQERIFRRGYATHDGQDVEQFTFAVTFVCLQCLFYSIFAQGKLHWTPTSTVRYQLLVSRAVILMTRDHSVNETHQGYFAFAAIFYLVALITSNTALQFISYPSQVIGKGLYTQIVGLIFHIQFHLCF